MTNIFEVSDAPRFPETPYHMTEHDQFIGSVSNEDQSDLIQTTLSAGFGYIARVQFTAVSDQINVQFINEAGDYASYYNSHSGHTAIQSVSGEDLFLRLGHIGGVVAATEYSVSVDQEISNTIETATSLSNDGTLDSSIEYSGDSDWIRLELNSGHGYVFDVVSSDENANLRIVLRGSVGETLASVDNSILNPNESARSGYTPLEDEVVFLSVYGRLTWTGDYSVSVQQEAVGSGQERDDVVAEASLSQLSLSLDAPIVEGFDFRGDTDFFQVDLVQNASYRFVASYSEPENGAFTSPLILFGESGTEVAATSIYDDQLPERSLEFTAQESGSFILQILNSATLEAFPDVLGSSYLLSLERSSVFGTEADERLVGSVLDDTLNGGDGSDTLIGDASHDILIGGETEYDLRDVIYAGAGNDRVDGGYGNDELRGDAGNDTIAGGFGADTVIGGTGHDTLTGSAFADQMFGGDGDDFVNGGFGHDLLNGGAGADRFYHIGIADHGSDWV
ncbi:MAG: calcium-binding protein, partial [Shimia thalassica]|uniref:calcium-binding protein n=1 Tax=Shimia thalassica TaxID=1715693 RepID=UPI003296F306